MEDARPGGAEPGRTAVTTRGPLPGLIGFLALLVVLLAASYAVGTLAGPVAPGIHPGGPAGTDAGGTGTGGADTGGADTGGMDMGGMDMGGMDMEETSR
ncbi:hypothetical protein LUX12_04360 [Streptomyces somaliensis]|uniref:hypothetical protein n=1 Tax=Streptomyces somaliensis TaxID=78355 RepID=UPI0020CD8632|nr:hypothetical protein [Streptomyces somaliensis]MCP9944195.1 hypothetical protein [Streptomyces somaliensis]MCP9962568.1 hypothetical protein [Streptomyces somaliensis]MCP9975398.1 hypothetical protein [Streptomyces somaliensis]